MFNIEVIKLIQSKKQERLDEIISSTHINIKEMDNLEKEINYLNLVIVRYEIAKLLGLDNNETYLSVNFLGVEDEDVDNYNLTPEQMNEYNRLKTQIDPKQLNRYNIRKRIADVVGEEISSHFKDKDYEGIEKINLSLVRYNLTDEQIKRFENLASLVGKEDDFTTRVNISEEAKLLITKIFTDLDTSSSDKYNKIKNDDFGKLDELLKVIDQNTKNLFFLNVSNHDLAYDLTVRYPEIAVKMNIVGVKKMISAMDLSTMTPEKYDKCLEMLCSSINELYAQEANKNVIEGFINNIGKNNYTLRSDLVSNLTNIENVQLDIQDNEYVKFVNYIRQNYNNLEEKDREKYYTLLKRRIDMANDGDVPLFLEFLNEDFDKLSDLDKDKYYSLLKTIVSRDINDLDKTEDLNELLVQITNKDLSKRLQKDFINNQNIKFVNMYLTSHDALVQDTVRKLEKKKSEYQKKLNKGGVFSALLATKIRDVDKKIAAVKNVTVNNDGDNYDDSSRLKKLNDSYNKKTTQIISREKQIEELKKIKSQLQSNFLKNRIDKKIDRRTEIIKKLKQSKVKIVGKQKKVMLPQVALAKRKGMFSAHLESKSEVFSDYAKDYKKLADAERKMDGFFGSFKALYHDLKANRYERKSKFNQNMCDLLRSSNVKVTGDNRYLVASDKLNQARNKQKTPAARTM